MGIWLGIFLLLYYAVYPLCAGHILLCLTKAPRAEQLYIPRITMIGLAVLVYILVGLIYQVGSSRRNRIGFT